MSGLQMTMGMPMGGPGSSSSPQPPTGYQSAGGLWLRADKLLTPGNAVATWTDLSGNGNNFTQGTGSAQPICTAGAGPKASQPAVVFASANSQQLAFGAALLPIKNFTLAITGKSLSNASAMVWLTSGNNGANGFFIGTDVNGTNERGFNANGNTAITDGTATTAWESWIFSSDASGNLTFIMNGATTTLSPTAATAITPSASTNIGQGGNARFLNGSIWEVLIYPTALASFTSLKTYLSQSTGLF